MNLLSLFSEKRDIRTHYTDSNGLSLLQSRLKDYLMSANGRQVILLCIGTDRSTGDSLGPLTGTKLLEKNLPGLTVIGTLEKPVHAENLEATLADIHSTYPSSFIIALDACLGSLESIGCITLAYGALKPGTAVKKNLPEVGEIHFTGIVNINGFMQYMILQNTRLNLVWEMSEALCSIFCQAYLSNIPLDYYRAAAWEVESKL